MRDNKHKLIKCRALLDTDATETQCFVSESIAKHLNIHVDTHSSVQLMSTERHNSNYDIVVFFANVFLFNVSNNTDDC